MAQQSAPDNDLIDRPKHCSSLTWHLANSPGLLSRGLHTLEYHTSLNSLQVFTLKNSVYKLKIFTQWAKKFHHHHYRQYSRVFIWRGILEKRFSENKWNWKLGILYFYIVNFLIPSFLRDGGSYNPDWPPLPYVTELAWNSRSPYLRLVSHIPVCSNIHLKLNIHSFPWISNTLLLLITYFQTTFCCSVYQNSVKSLKSYTECDLDIQ